MVDGDDITGVLALLFIVAVVLWSISGAIGFGQMRSPSDYQGYVVDVEHNRGILFRTTQVYLKTHPRSSSAEEFCIVMPRDSDLLDQARDALQNRSKVSVEYSRPLWVNPFDCKSRNSVVRDIRPINNSTG